MIRCCHPYARESASRAILSRMQLILYATRLTPHGASRLGQAMSVSSSKTRRAPSRHCRDARVYGHTTTAMHGMRTPPPSLSTPSYSNRTRCIYPPSSCRCSSVGMMYYYSNTPPPSYAPPFTPIKLDFDTIELHPPSSCRWMLA